MKQAMRKMYLSVITSILVLVVTCTTTYAWTGILSYSSIEEFNVELKKEETADYSLQISLDGINFGYGIYATDLKKQILSNMGINTNDLSDSLINSVFSSLRLNPVSTQIKDNVIGSFVNLEQLTKNSFIYSEEVETSDTKKSYYNFDIYLSVEYNKKDPSVEALEDYQSIYLSNIAEMFRGKDKTVALSTKRQLTNYLTDEILRIVTVNSASTARLSITKYEAVEKGMPDIKSNIIDTYIFQGGTSVPSKKDDVYSFGGILPQSDNLAFMEYNSIHSKNQISNFYFEEFYLNRLAKEEKAISDPNIEGFWIVDENDMVNTKKMIRLNIKMWIEGFDADCFEVISALPVSFNLLFTTKKDI